jgi:glycosyltransferase involved in cell wall biosynthesis
MTTVLHIITTLGSGGAERALHLLASRSRGTADPRHIVVSLSGDGVYGAELRDAGIEVRALEMQSRRTSLGGFLRLVQLMREIQPDVVMTWLYHADLLGTIAARMAGISLVIWNIRCSDMDLTHYPALTRFIVHVLAHLSWLPWGIATNSKQGRRAHEALGYKSARWFYLPNGFDADQWRPDPVDRAKVRAELGIPDTDFIIAMVARVDPQKDHANFLAAARLLAATHANLWFLLVGSETDKLAICDALRRRTIALGERRDVPRLMRAVDLLASSSNSEGFPNVIGEAMATGVPCVATDVGDTAAIIGEVGRLVPPGDPRALAHAMCEIIDASPDERHALGVRARHRVCENFTVDNCMGRYAQLFRTALASTLNVQNSQTSTK